MGWDWNVVGVCAPGLAAEERLAFEAFLQDTLGPRGLPNDEVAASRAVHVAATPDEVEPAILERLAAGDIVVFPFDQHAGRRDGVRVEFFGHSAGTFRSVALIAQASGAPVLPASSWREPDGRHVLRFEAPLERVEREDVGEEIRANTRLFNAALERMILRHPEQWWWVHRRWKAWPAKKKRRA